MEPRSDWGWQSLFFVLLVSDWVGLVLGGLAQDDGDFLSLSRNLTRCSTTRLVFGKESLLHTWDLTGFFKYMKYLQSFDESFEVRAEDVSFKSDNIDGKWAFKLVKARRPGQILPRTDDGGGPTTSKSTRDNESWPIKISATYSYDAREQKRINFGIYLTIVYDNTELVLPLQKATEPSVSQMRSYSTRTPATTPYFTFTYQFNWPDVYEEFGRPTSQPPAESSKKSGFANEDSLQDLSLRFLVTAYYPKDPVSVSGESCGETLTPVEQIFTKPWGHHTRPPFMKHMWNMLENVQYADMILQVGDNHVPAHRIILANASPVLSSLIYNETFMGPAYDYNGTDAPLPLSINPMPVIHIDDDIDNCTVRDMLKYIYTGKVDGMPQNAKQLLIASDRYELHDLKRMSEKVIVRQVNVQNSIDMYKLGTEVRSPKLLRKAFEVIKANKAKIVSQPTEFRKLSTEHPSLMFELFLAS